MAFLNDSGSDFQVAQTVEVNNPNLGSGADIENTNDAVAKAPLGVLFRYKGAVYRYVQFDNGAGDVASVAGGVSFWKTRANTYPVSNDKPEGSYIISSDYSDAISVNHVAGILGGVVTDQYYTWIQVGGVATAKVAASTAIGDIAIGASTDLVFGRIAADASITNRIAGIALSAINTPSTGKSYVLLVNLF